MAQRPTRPAPSAPCRRGGLRTRMALAFGSIFALTLLAIQAVDNSYHNSTEDAQRLEANMFGLLASTTDMHEGMNAFLEKRTADFKGN
jgi:enoyl-CoA hydratase/carnithine racemase